MQPSDRADFLRVLNGMAAMKKTALIPEVLDLWWLCMEDWSIQEFKAAAVHVMKRSDFMPGPKDFEDLRKAGRPSAGEAWAKVLESVRAGTWRWEGMKRQLRPDFIPPEVDQITLAAVEAIGGYNAIAMHEEATLHFLERRFCEHYNDIGDRQQIRDAVPQIANSRLSLSLDSAKKLLTQ